MSKHKDTTIPLESGNFYHIFNRGNKCIKIFHKHDNYVYFLKKYDSYLSNYLDTYAYALIPNHFHFLVRIKEEAEILQNARNEYGKVSKALWKLIREKMEEYPKALFQSYQGFAKLMEQGFPKEPISMISFIEMMPSILLYFVANWILSDRFRRFFAAYAMAINKQEKEVGALFQRPFRRKLIDSETYFT
ncbi:MAG: hypothetical protein AAGJ18_16905, partial [Bacteroidota bacterium]